MKEILFTIRLLLSVVILSYCSYGQSMPAVQNLKVQADKMGSAFTNGDYKTFASYTYPPILKSMGGTSKMIEVLTKATNDMKTKGMSFGKISFNEPSKVVQSWKELQTTIAQHTEIKLSQGRLVSTSTLIAISADNGATWTFVDTSNKDMAEVYRK